MKKELKIYLFRHGQTTFNRDGRFTGWMDPSLTAKGVQNAKTIARKLRNKKFEVAIHSHLRRSKQTLKEVLKFHPECKEILEDDRMIERNYGELNGISHEDFIKNIGQRLWKLDVHGDAIENLSAENKKKLKRFLGGQEYEIIHRGYAIPPPKGESFAMVEKRVSAFIKDLIKMMKKKNVNVAISAHGNSIRMFRKIMEKASVAKTVSWVIPYEEFFEYTIN